MTLAKQDYLIIALLNVMLFLGLQLQLAYSQTQTAAEEEYGYRI